jgi:Tol biopolymer transport system component
MRFDRFDYTVWIVGLLLALIIGGLVWGGNQRGISIDAPVEAEMSSKEPFVIQFPQPVNPESIQGLFSLNPDVPGEVIVQNDQLLFIPQLAFTPGEEYTARLKAGATVQDGRQVKKDHAWNFSVRDPWIVYQAYEENEIYRIPLSGGQSEQLTDSDGLIFDFVPAQAGDRIAYTVINQQKGIDIWVVGRNGGGKKLLINCGLDRCSAPAWSPDGSQLAYSRAEAGLGPDEPHGAPRIWLADTRSGETMRLFSSSEKIGYGPSWSPDGRKLAYSDGVNSQLVILDLETGNEFFIPTQSGRVGSWSPDSSQMVYSDFISSDQGVIEAVNRVDFDSQDIINLFGHRPNEYSYSGPVWSPTGEKIAAVARVAQSEIKYELMLMAADADFGYTLANEPNYTYLNYCFDPTGSYLLYQRTQLSVSYPKPEILVIDLQTKEIVLSIPNASFPAWLP